MNMKLRHKLPKKKMKIKMGAAVEVTYHVDVKIRNSKTGGKERKIKKRVRKLRNGCFGNRGRSLFTLFFFARFCFNAT